VHSQINKLNKIGLFCCNVCLSTSKFEFSAACWSEAEIPPPGVEAKRKSRLNGAARGYDKIVTQFYSDWNIDGQMSLTKDFLRVCQYFTCLKTTVEWIRNQLVGIIGIRVPIVGV
jgi:hypothetical protein